MVRDGVVDFEAAALLNLRTRDGNSQLVKATEFLAALLRDGPLPARTVQTSAEAAGISGRTLERAKQGLGVVSKKRGHSGTRGGGEWVWELPQ